MATKIVIVVDGGVVTSVLADEGADVEVQLIDWDNIRENDPDEIIRDEADRHLDQCFSDGMAEIPIDDWRNVE